MMTMAMALRIWSELMAVAIASRGEESGDAAAAAVHIEKVELRMENVSKRYGGRQVVDGMSMTVTLGEMPGLLGPNGAGESTAFNIMVGRERPSGGSVLLVTMDITTLSLPHRARLGIGYMTQESSVFGGLSVHDNIRLILEETGVPRAQHAHRVQDLIEEFSLLPVKNTMGEALSGGDRWRMEPARALASNCSEGPSKILLVDECFAGAVPSELAKSGSSCGVCAKEEELGVLITDQNVNETLSICDRAYRVCHEFRRS